MEFKQLMIDVVRYLAAFTATEDMRDIGAARTAIHRYAQEHGSEPELVALWDVTISVQRHI